MNLTCPNFNFINNLYGSIIRNAFQTIFGDHLFIFYQHYKIYKVIFVNVKLQIQRKNFNLQYFIIFISKEFMSHHTYIYEELVKKN